MTKQTGARIEAKLQAGIKDRPPGRHGFGDGLWLEVAGGRSWTFRFMMGGKARSMGLGAWPAVGLADARKRIADARVLIAGGVDPIEKRKQDKAAEAVAQARETTFTDAAEGYITAHEPTWRNAKHRQQWRNTLVTYAYPVVGKLALPDITTEHVLRVLRPIWTAKPETAVRVRGRIETVLAYGIVQGWCPEPNVARWHNHLQMTLPPRSKVKPVTPHAALSSDELPEFMLKLRTQDGFGAMALEFAILTAARSGEVRGATWDEIDFAASTWTISGSRMKAGRPHVVPLSAPALALLRKAERLRGPGDFIFPGMRANTPLSDMSLGAVLKRMGHANVTTHGMRAVFKTWASDETEFPREIIEAALAHSLGDKAERTYMRGSWLKRRRELMGSWADFCLTPPPRDEAAQVGMVEPALA